MLRQFNANFVDLHLVPFFKEVLKDAVENPKEYHQHIFVSGFLTEQEKKLFEQDYFISRKNDSRIPFTNDSDVRERRALIDFLVEHIGKYSAAPFERGRAFLPVKLGETEVFQFHDVPNRNIHLMAYELVRQFEKKRLQELVEEKKQKGDPKAREDEVLLKKGQLMLVKKGNDFHDYVRKDEAKGKKVVPFATGPSVKSASILAGQAAGTAEAAWRPGLYGADVNALQDETVADEVLLRLFEERQVVAGLESLQAYNMQLIGATHAMAAAGHGLVVSGKVQCDVSVRVVDDEKSKQDRIMFDFRFLEGALAGQSFSVSEEDLQQLSKKGDGTRRTLEELYKLWKERRTVEALEELSQRMPLGFAVQDKDIPHERMADFQPLPTGFRLTGKIPGEKTVLPKEEGLANMFPTFQTKTSPPRSRTLGSKDGLQVNFLEQAKRPSIMELKEQMRKKREAAEQQPAGSGLRPSSAYAQPAQGQRQEQQTIRRRAPSKKRLSPGVIAAVATGGAVAGTFGAIFGIPFLF